jgi:hypothetical protein
MPSIVGLFQDSDMEVYFISRKVKNVIFHQFSGRGIRSGWFYIYVHAAPLKDESFGLKADYAKRSRPGT